MLDRDDSDDDLRYREDDLRGDLMASFDLFDKGTLTAENAYDMELPAKTEPAAKTERDGGASGADQGDRGGQHTGRADRTPATGGEQDSRERQRDAQGRFAKGEGDNTGEAKPAGADAGAKPLEKPAASEQQAKPQASAAQQPPAASPEPAPEGMGTKATQLWATATPEVRAYIAETESALAKIAEPFTAAMTAAKEISVPWNQYVGNLVKTEKYLRANPMEAMIWIAERQGVDLDELADYALERRQRGGQGQSSGQQQIPQEFQHVVAPLAEQVAQLTSRLSQREQAEANARQQAETSQREAYKREVAAFAEKNPHWETVKGEAFALMSHLARQNPNRSFGEILKDAYDRAVYANPEVRAKLAAEAEAAQREKQRGRASRELEAVTSHRGTPPNGSGRSANGSGNLRDEIAANWAAYDAR